MGVDYNHYLGVYVEVDIYLVKKQFDRCKKPDVCPNPTSGYCATCGLNVKNRYHTEEVEEPWTDEEEEEGIHDVSSFSKEAFGCTDYMCSPETEVKNKRRFRTYKVTPNKRRDGLRSYDVDCAKYEEVTTHWPDANAAEDIAAFEKAYAKELERLYKKFGKENVRIRWGFLQYAS